MILQEDRDMAVKIMGPGINRFLDMPEKDVLALIKKEFSGQDDAASKSIIATVERREAFLKENGSIMCWA